ncbi:MAG TPA: FAD-binding oxidoreductase [Burkholderiales bacterium]|nr:FAD-binding oxidoreductase [Burkholderiales bacterium]
MAAPLAHPFTVVDDAHSSLNPTLVAGVVHVRSVADIRRAVLAAAASGSAVSICGARHAMGGQQFGTGSVLLDTSGFQRVLAFDPARGLIEVEAGIRWPALHDWLRGAQRVGAPAWSFRQKQTGADALSLGGCLSANVHGRGLDLPPFVSEVESFTLVDAAGELHRCSRAENADLFRLAIGGYGLFGAIATLTLRLVRRHKVRRIVEILDVDTLIGAFGARIAAGFAYGDFQFSIDPASAGFLRRGVFSCYEPVPVATPVPGDQRTLSPDDWKRLVTLAHTDKAAAFAHYARHYLATSGQVYWSDTHQMSVYLDDYHRDVDRALGHRGSEAITEIYVPRARLADFMTEAAADFRKERVDAIYGTVRLIRRDDETFLAWARDDYACVIFNLHVRHDAAGKAHAADAFRRLIDMALARGGSYYLTYHRHATRAQVEACHPRFGEFLALKRRHDPGERFQSDWYRHYRDIFATA